MKNFLLTAVALLLSVMTAAQTDYEMVVEKTDGSKSVFNTNIIKQTYFQKLDQESGIFQGAKRVFGNNLVKAFGEEGEDRYEITYDAKGFVTSINRTIFYESGNRLYSWLFNYNTAGKIIINYYRDGMLYNVYYATVCSNGYISSIRIEQSFEATLSYDNEEHLTQIMYYDIEEEEGASIYYDTDTFSWMDGDLIRDCYHEYDDDEDYSNIAYISPSQTSPIENVAGIMEFDHGMNIDMDDFSVLYYIGGWGRGTKHLPMAWVSDSGSGNNAWTLDTQNRAIKLVHNRKYNSDSESTTRTFFWEW